MHDAREEPQHAARPLKIRETPPPMIQHIDDLGLKGITCDKPFAVLGFLLAGRQYGFAVGIIREVTGNPFR